MDSLSLKSPILVFLSQACTPEERWKLHCAHQEQYPLPRPQLYNVRISNVWLSYQFVCISYLGCGTKDPKPGESENYKSCSLSHLWIGTLEMSLLGGSGSFSFQSCQSELLLALGLIRTESFSSLIHVAEAARLSSSPCSSHLRTIWVSTGHGGCFARASSLHSKWARETEMEAIVFGSDTQPILQYAAGHKDCSWHNVRGHSTRVPRKQGSCYTAHINEWWICW